jgi:hypothetical protein
MLEFGVLRLPEQVLLAGQLVTVLFSSNGLEVSFVSPELDAVSVYPLSGLSSVRPLNVATPWTAF